MQVEVTYHEHPDPACVVTRITMNGVTREAIARNALARAALAAAKRLQPKL